MTPECHRRRDRALFKRAGESSTTNLLAKAAERFLRRQVELEDTSPFHDAPAARVEHAARMSEEQGPPRSASMGRRGQVPPEARSRCAGF